MLLDSKVGVFFVVVVCFQCSGEVDIGSVSVTDVRWVILGYVVAFNANTQCWCFS